MRRSVVKVSLFLRKFPYIRAGDWSFVTLLDSFRKDFHPRFLNVGPDCGRRIDLIERNMSYIKWYKSADVSAEEMTTIGNGARNRSATTAAPTPAER